MPSETIPSPTDSRILVRGVHFNLTPALRTAAEEKAARLLRHEERIIRIRLDLEHDKTRDPRHAFVAKGHIEIRGPDLIASVDSEEPQKSLDSLIDKLDGLLRKRAGAAMTKRHHPHGVEIPSILPKID
jgi:putative sigma-54 modulation protein